MIYCVRFAAVEAHLSDIGFTLIADRDENRFYARGEENLTIRGPNVNGDLPEIVFVEAFDAAGLTPPDLPVHWCD